jgi:hypothetical protein
MTGAGAGAGGAVNAAAGGATGAGGSVLGGVTGAGTSVLCAVSPFAAGAGEAAAGKEVPVEAEAQARGSLSCISMEATR